MPTPTTKREALHGTLRPALDARAPRRRRSHERDTPRLVTPEEEAIGLSFPLTRRVGSTGRRVAELQAIADEADVDEVMVFTMLPDLEARKHSYALLAEEFAVR